MSDKENAVWISYKSLIRMPDGSLREWVSLDIHDKICQCYENKIEKLEKQLNEQGY
jgi:hypothetical protein